MEAEQDKIKINWSIPTIYTLDFKFTNGGSPPEIEETMEGGASTTPG